MTGKKSINPFILNGFKDIIKTKNIDFTVDKP